MNRRRGGERGAVGGRGTSAGARTPRVPIPRCLNLTDRAFDCSYMLDAQLPPDSLAMEAGCGQGVDFKRQPVCPGRGSSATALWGASSTATVHTKKLGNAAAATGRLSFRARLRGSRWGGCRRRRRRWRCASRSWTPPSCTPWGARQPARRCQCAHTRHIQRLDCPGPSCWTSSPFSTCRASHTCRAAVLFLCATRAPSMSDERHVSFGPHCCRHTSASSGRRRCRCRRTRERQASGAGLPPAAAAAASAGRRCRRPVPAARSPRSPPSRRCAAREVFGECSQRFKAVCWHIGGKLQKCCSAMLTSSAHAAVQGRSSLKGRSWAAF